MKKKILIVVTVLLIFPLVTPMSTVQATPSFNSSYWQNPLHPRKVITTKRVKICKINGNVPGYKQRVVKKKWLKKGSVVHVTQLASWPWGFSGKIPGIGKASKNGYFWVYMKRSSNWLVKYSKKNLKKYGN